MKIEHEQVLRTMYQRGLITRQAMKSIRGQLIKLQTDQERETYLKRIIANAGRRKRNDRARESTAANTRISMAHPS